MDIEVTKVDKAVVVKLIGRMDADTCKQFDAAWDKQLAEGSKFLVVDLSQLNYINSAGIGSFLRNAKLAAETGGGLRISGIKGMVKEIFTMTQLITVFQVFDSPGAACQNFG